MSVFVHAQGIEFVHAGGGGAVKKWQNSVHVLVECPLSKHLHLLFSPKKPTRHVCSDYCTVCLIILKFSQNLNPRKVIMTINNLEKVSNEAFNYAHVHLFNHLGSIFFHESSDCAEHLFQTFCLLENNSDEERRFMYRIDQGHLTIFCIVFI